MKKMKKIVSLLLAMVMVMAMTVVASAATITVPEGKRFTHAYFAYQIFTGSQADNKGALGNPKWGTGIDAAKFLAALKASSNEDVKTAFADNKITVDTPEAVVKQLGTFATDSDAAKEIAKLAYANKKGTGTELETTTEVASGYYLIVDETEKMGEGDAYNAALLQVTSNITIRDKTDAPSIEKKVLDNKNNSDATDDKWEDANNAAVGEEVKYKLTSKVPNMEYYDQYYFVMHDHLSKGLSYGVDKDDESKVYGEIKSITIGGKTLKEGTLEGTEVKGDYAVVAIPTQDENGNSTGTDVTIIFGNFIQYKEAQYKDAVIEVQYTATVNKDAIIGNEGNPNSVYLEYSNNPNEKGEGKDKPGDSDDVTGVTPTDWVETYVTEIVINKIDGEGKVVTGAEFTLEGTQLKKAKVTREEFKKDAKGTYYKLDDGTYTMVAPIDDTASKYEKDPDTNEYVMYVKNTVTEWVGTGETELEVKATVGDDGVLKFTGLSAGTYTLKETVTPAGYNTAEPQEITITCTETDKFDDASTITCVWNYNDTNPIEVVNLKGATLPETGGIGTTIFYVLGAILVIGAGLVLVTKKRMGAEK